MAFVPTAAVFIQRPLSFNTRAALTSSPPSGNAQRHVFEFASEVKSVLASSFHGIQLRSFEACSSSTTPKESGTVASTSNQGFEFHLGRKLADIASNFITKKILSSGQMSWAELGRLDQSSLDHLQQWYSAAKKCLPELSNSATQRVLASVIAAFIVSFANPLASQSALAAETITAAPQRTVDVARFNRENWIYSQFMDAVEKHEVERVTFSSDMTRAVVVDVDGNRHKVDLPPFNGKLLQNLMKNDVNVAVSAEQATSDNAFLDLLSSLLVPGLFIAGLYFLSRRASGGQGPGGIGGRGNPLNMGRSTARVNMEPQTGVTFKDVAGISQAKLELEEVVDFLKDPSRYTTLGAKIPRGVILTGPPGTGKTLLARAVAGEAGVPFFSISGSEFVEMFVGVGASRVRDLFAQAKKNAPCIVFIDEIDAVGRQRGGAGGFGGGGNDEREQTLNQLLTEMDGFEGNTGVIVIAATNRVDVLDNALLRPGRFDRTITVDLPDFRERRAILDVHARGKPLSADVQLDSIARRTPGFSGASLANLLNEAAILGARRKQSSIGPKEVDDALDRIILGAEKTDRVITDKIKNLVAYHEAGHALVGALMPDYDVVQKVSIIPRGGAGGVTFFAPDEERVDSGMYSRSYLENQMAVALGGRVAEEVVFGENNITTGASNDIQQVTNIARRMVTQFGMSKRIGTIQASGGNSFNSSDPVSAETQGVIDQEVRELVEVAYQKAKKLVTDHRKILDSMANLLMDQETIQWEDILKLLADNGIVKESKAPVSA
eukprot:CAMPEP_0196652516 /NCGR_PEP_ID=MMETSP1086-20130531/1839_1 /TAXON_ID=77921 /ORGANISM="Cyanoptyche  gloeocystis , Strain SAG4.97" /LENGTH=777 /DNA_ID=CAMNT_0041983111 /DNA_START=46 /DNA_END=2379 /DNA_ORIENTATION=-